MRLLKRIFITVVVLTINLQFSTAAFSQNDYLNSKEDVQVYSPQSRSTPEIDIPEEKTKNKRSWLSRNKWWVIGGLLIIGGAAAAGSGGGENSGNGETPAGEDTGRATVGW